MLVKKTICFNIKKNLMDIINYLKRLKSTKTINMLKSLELIRILYGSDKTGKK